MLKSKQPIKSLVIQYYINGVSRDKIAKDVGLSAGTVSNTIRDWKAGIGHSHAEEIRDFSVMVNKSGISIRQCVQGARMVNILKHLGIKDTDETGNGDCDDADEIISFLKIIYHGCKKFGISPEIVPAWIKDLLDCCHRGIIPSTQTADRVSSNYGAPLFANDEGIDHVGNVSTP